MRRAPFPAAGLLAVVALSIPVPARAEPAEPDPAIRDLVVEPAASELRVSFRVEGALRVETLERLQSGMTVVFRHRIDVLTRRTVPLFPLRLNSRTIVETSVRYDSLVRQYLLERRTVRTEPEGVGGPLVEPETASTPSLSEAEAWMTTVSGVPVSALSDGDAARRPRVRVRTELGRRYRLLIFPFADAAEAEQALGP